MNSSKNLILVTLLFRLENKILENKILENKILENKMSRLTINRILSLNYSPSQIWRTRKNGGDKNLVKQSVIRIIDLISGLIFSCFVSFKLA